MFIFWYTIIMRFGLSFKGVSLNEDLKDRVNITLAVKFGILTHLTKGDLRCDRFYIDLP